MGIFLNNFSWICSLWDCYCTRINYINENFWLFNYS